ncbi:MAG: AraC family transcriptional regulator [Gammaproteobacteria bacterium]
MDVVSDICRTIRLEGSVFFRSDLSAPWGIELPAAHEPRFHVVLQGSMWFQTDKMTEPKRMNAGDVIIIPEGEWHWIADRVGRECVPSAEAGAAANAGRPMFQGDTIATRLLCGLFRFDQVLEHPLISALPDLVQLLNEDSAGHRFLLQTASWLFDEFDQEAPGASVLVDRLCEVFFIQALRSIQEIRDYSTGFLAALKDQRINKALQLIHHHPEFAWTLEELADQVAMSRAVFADRFAQLVGSPPKAYLTAWRMQQALNLIKGTVLPVMTIAEKVGYTSDISFNRAFQRYFDMTPTEYRKNYHNAV